MGNTSPQLLVHMKKKLHAKSIIQFPNVYETLGALGGDTHVTEEEEGEEKGQPSPHPRLEALYRRQQTLQHHVKVQ